jgi:hypothetical protein
MNTMRMVTKIYKISKILNINERAMNERDSKWMGGEEREWVLGWWVMERCYIGERYKIRVSIARLMPIYL